MTQITIQMRKKSYSIESTWEEYKKVRFEMGLARWSDYNKQRWMEVTAFQEKTRGCEKVLCEGRQCLADKQKDQYIQSP